MSEEKTAAGVLTLELLQEVKDNIENQQEKFYKDFSEGKIVCSTVRGWALNNVYNTEDFEDNTLYAVMSNGNIKKYSEVLRPTVSDKGANNGN